MTSAKWLGRVGLAATAVLIAGVTTSADVTGITANNPSFEYYPYFTSTPWVTTGVRASSPSFASFATDSGWTGTGDNADATVAYAGVYDAGHYPGVYPSSTPDGVNAAFIYQGGQSTGDGNGY